MATTRNGQASIQHLALPIRSGGGTGAASAIAQALSTVPGVTQIHVNLRTEMVYVAHEGPPFDERVLRAALDRAGYGEESLLETPRPMGRGEFNGFSLRRWVGVTVAFLVITGFLLVMEYRASAFAALSLLLIVGCSLLHLYVHRGRGGHRGHSLDRRSPGRSDGTGRVVMTPRAESDGE